tara:strand:- start:705 stop:1076 length:372 start_codon:yes stop_codon:yes gene_type:complete
MHSFNKLERLSSKAAIKKLFEEGEAIVASSFLLLWKENTDKYSTTQTLISVPKRNISLATKRNLIKRRVNEAFRVNKEKLYAKLLERNKQINIAIIYQKKEIQTYKIIEQKINLLLNRLIHDL